MKSGIYAIQKFCKCLVYPIYINSNLDTKVTSYSSLKTYNYIEEKNTKFTSLKKNKEVTYLNYKCWERLKSMTFETYVPESETSKSGAGY